MELEITSIHSLSLVLFERLQNSASLEDALFMYCSNSTYVQIMYVHCTELGRAATVRTYLNPGVMEVILRQDK